MTSRPFFRRPGVLLVTALAVVAIVVSILGKLAGGPEPSQKSIALADARGAEAYPAFSPNGKSMAFSARLAKDEPYHLFIRSLPNGQRRQFTSAEGSDTGPAFSPDGASVAFLRIEDGRGECLVAPVDGGEARKIADCAAQFDPALPAVAWTPDGKSLVVSAAEENGPAALALVPVAGGAPARLTEPPAGAQGDSTPAVSPNGQTIAFVRAVNSDGADIYACDLSGHNQQRITFDNQPIRGLAWTAEGSHLVYGGYRMGNWRLWRLPANGGTPRDLGFANKSAQFPAVAAASLAYTLNPSVSSIWRAPADAGEGTEGEELIRSSGREVQPAYSPNGQYIIDVSDQSGADEIWLSDPDGGSRRQLTHLKGRARPTSVRWSPDGRTLAFELITSDSSEIDAVPASGGEPKRILANAGSPSWSYDGASIYFVAGRQIGKIAASGGERLTLTSQQGSEQPQESPDGKYVYFLRFGAIWRVPSGGGAEEDFMRPEDGSFIVGTGRVTGKGMYYLNWGRGGRRNVGVQTRGGVRFLNLGTATLSFYDFDAKQSREVFSVRVRNFSGLALSPDGKYVLYPRTDESQTSLMLVEGFR